MRASAARPAHATAADVAAAAPPQQARSSPQDSTTLSPQPSSERSAAVGGTESNNQLLAIGGVGGEAETAAGSSSALLSAASESHPHEGDKQAGCTRQKWDAAYRRNQKRQPLKASLSLLDGLNLISLQRVAQKLNETLPRNHYIATKKVRGNGADVIRAEIRNKWTMAKASKTDAENLTEASLLQL